MKTILTLILSTILYSHYYPPLEYQLEILQETKRELIMQQVIVNPKYNEFIRQSILTVMYHEIEMIEDIRKKNNEEK
jgi:hypothetical protein